MIPFPRQLAHLKRSKGRRKGKKEKGKEKWKKRASKRNEISRERWWEKTQESKVNQRKIHSRRATSYELRATSYDLRSTSYELRPNFAHHTSFIYTLDEKEITFISKGSSNLKSGHLKSTMQWGYVFAWVAAVFALFLVTGWPVTPSLDGTWGNHYNAKNLTYYAVLYFHYLIGALFFSFLVLGLLRNLIWKGDSGGTKQLAYLLAYSTFIASIFAIGLVHLYAPDATQAVDNEEV